MEEIEMENDEFVEKNQKKLELFKELFLDTDLQIILKSIRKIKLYIPEVMDIDDPLYWKIGLELMKKECAIIDKLLMIINKYKNG